MAAAAERAEMRAVVDDTHAQVTTINGKTMANLADAGETRRVDAIPVADQTVGDREHLAAYPPEQE